MSRMEKNSVTQEARNKEGFSLCEIKELISSVRLGGISRLKIKHGEFSIEIEGGAGASSAAPMETLAPAPSAAATETEASEPAGNQVRSPIVGTFYAAPSPEAGPFVKEGDSVKKGDILFIIESMKLMNEIVSDFDGTVTAIHVGNAEGVEYGQPVMTIS